MRPSIAARHALMVLVLCPLLARALNEPNGYAVPIDSSPQTQLWQLFQSRGEPYTMFSQEVTNAATTPAVFSPLCNFQATFVLHQAGYVLGVGWYNAGPSVTAPPPLSAIHVVVPAGAPVGTVVTSMSIRSDPAYTGGLVGFALVGMQTHYTEQQWNPVCTSCTPNAPWILSLTYRSTVTPNAFYIAFEDGAVTATNFSNDGDFNDDVYFLDGLSCAGGDQPCPTGLLGICAEGLTQCTSTGTTCVAVVTPRPETCNGLDDNCNGMVDDGPGLCPAGDVCDRGRCVPMCVEGSCFAGQTCSSTGACVETACVTVTCPMGQICTGGACHGACDGVVCPGNQICTAGLCVDPCAGVTCAAGQVCNGGVCVTSCMCEGCATGLACNMTSGMCVDPSCTTVTCTDPMVCRGGTCVDPCTGAVCPAGQVCTAGSCVAAPPSPDAGVSDGGPTSGDASLDGHSGMGDARRDGSGGDGSTTGAHSGGCGCRTAGSNTRPAALGLLAVVALALGRRRRR